MAKICLVCGEDCSDRPRTKDKKGNYYCRACHDKALEKKRAARPEPSPDPAPVGLEPEIELDIMSEIVSQQDAAAPASSGRTCPQCKAPMPFDGVICVSCGYNMQTGGVLAVTEKKARGGGGGGEGIAGILLAPVTFGCAVGIINAITGVMALQDPGGSGAYPFLAFQGITGFAIVITTVVFAFLDSIVRGICTLCCFPYQLYFVYGICDNQYVKWLYTGNLIGVVFSVFWQINAPESAGGLGGFR